MKKDKNRQASGSPKKQPSGSPKVPKIAFDAQDLDSDFALGKKNSIELRRSGAPVRLNDNKSKNRDAHWHQRERGVKQGYRIKPAATNAMPKALQGGGAEPPAYYNVHAIMSDSYMQRRKIIKYAFLAMVFGACSVALYLRPDWRYLLFRKAYDLKERVQYVVAKFNEGEEKSNKIIEERQRKNSQPRISAGSGLDQELFKMASSRCPYLNSLKPNVAAGRVALTTKVAVSKCFIVNGSMANAELALRDVRTSLFSMSDSQMEGRAAVFGDALYILVYINSSKGDRGRLEINRLIGNRCRGWAANTACIAKLMHLTCKGLSGTAARGFQSLLGETGSLSRIDKTRFWHNGAKIAALAGDKALAKERFKSALRYTTEDTILAKKLIYEDYMKLLYYYGDMAAVHALMFSAKTDLQLMDQKAFVKLKLLDILASSRRQRKVLESFLNHNGVLQRILDDTEFVTLLGPEAFRQGLEKDYMKLILRTKNYFTNTFRDSTNALKNVALWEIRTMIVMQDYEAARKRLVNYRLTYRDDQHSHHLRGIVLMRLSSHEQYQMLAALEFQKSLRQQNSWEGLYALGVALVQGGKKTKANAVLQSLNGQALNESHLHWQLLLLAQIYLADGQTKAAITTLHKVIMGNPSSFLAHELLMQAYREAGDIDKAQGLEMSLAEIKAKTRYLSTKEGLRDPLGPLALTRTR